MTLTKTAVDATTRAEITEVKPGVQFYYLLSIGCPSRDCEAVELTDVLPDDIELVPNGNGSIDPPAGGTASFAPTAGVWTGKTITAKWSLINGPTEYLIPVQLSEKTAYSHNGEVRANTASLEAQNASGTTTLDSTANVTLKIGQIPGLKGAVTKSWAKEGGGTSVLAGSGAETNAVIKAIANANTTSDLTFTEPGADAPPAGKRAAFDAFDLTKVTLSQNPNGATITYKLTNGSTQNTTLDAGVLTDTPPSNVVGYTVVVKGLKGAADSTDAERTVTLTSGLKLRDTLRSDSSTPVVEPGVGTVAVRNTAEVKNTVARPDSGSPASVTDSNAIAEIGVNEVTPSVAQSKTWVTASGDAYSTYGSGEAATLVVRASNTGVPTLQKLTITDPAPNSGSTAFIFEQVTSAPRLKFPTGATSATIQYQYLDGSGAEQTIISPGATVPGVDAGKSWADVSGVIVSFNGTHASPITGNCELTDDTCAATVTIPTKLRNNRLDNNQAITIPYNGVSTPVSNAAAVSAVASIGSIISNNTKSVTLSIVPSQYYAIAEKKMGDSSDRVSYPLTGAAQAGDHYDPGASPQSYKEHVFSLSGGTASSQNASETQGAKSITFTDPPKTPTVASLKDNPFNLIKFTSLPSGNATCSSEENNVAANTVTEVWVVDSATTPTSIEKKVLDGAVDLEKIVGVQYTITPSGASEFPRAVTCDTPDGKVKWRDALVSDSTTEVTPDLGNANYPGLLAVGNQVQVTTELASSITSGTNKFKATASDQLYLADITVATGFKGYDKAPYDHTQSAPSSGIAGQGAETSFYIAGTSGVNSTATKISDGQLAASIGSADSSFDIFALTGVRDGRVGPDQTMTITLYDKDGQQVGPTGTFTGPTDGLTAAEIEDSQSAAYQKVFTTKRAITWVGDAPSAAELASVARVEGIVVRTSNSTKTLQEYSASGYVLDVKLRDNRLFSGTAIEGTSTGVIKYNNAYAAAKTDSGWGTEHSSSASFRIYSVTEIYGNSTIDWKGTTAVPNLVAHDDTTSTFSLEANNTTATGSTNPAATGPTMWLYNDSKPVGVETMTSSVGDSTTNNPFALVDFTGITSIKWPLVVNPASKPDASDYVDGVITYTFANGTTQQVNAPYNPSPTAAYWASLNPSDPANVVGVSITFKEDGSLIGTKKNATTVQSQLRFSTVLREKTRVGYAFTFTSGNPGSNAANSPIDGPNRSEPQLPQVATATVGFAATASSLRVPDIATANSGSSAINLYPQMGGVSVSKVHNYPGGVQNTMIFRDWLPTTSWTIAAQNTGNSSVDSVRIAEPADVLDEATWPSSDPAGFEVQQGTMFDSFNLSGVNVGLPSAWPLTSPAGVVQADLYVRDASGTWHGPTSRTTNGAFALPDSDQITWEDVTAFRVNVAGVDGARIANGTSGKVIVQPTTKLREYRRTDSSVRAPGNSIAGGQTQWTVSNATDAATYLNQSSSAWAETIGPSTANATVGTGTPLPLAVKQIGAYSATDNTANKNRSGNPGDYSTFYLTVENSTGATADLRNIQIVDTMPSQLQYNPVSSEYQWSVYSKPDSVTDTPQLTQTVDPDTHRITKMTWTWPSSTVLKPGERIVIALPLQLADGTGIGASANNIMRVVGTGIDGAPATSRCDTDQSDVAQCVSTAQVTSLNTNSVRVEKFIKDLGHATTTGVDQDGDNRLDPCDATAQEQAWTDGTWMGSACQITTTVGEKMVYRLKVINSGNQPLKEMRMADEMPATGDMGVVLDMLRGSEWSPKYVPGSFTMVTGKTATDLGARGDGTATLRYSTSQNPCVLDPDAYGTNTTLSCTSNGGTWTSSDSAATKSLGADISFDTPLDGGEYVIFQYEMITPKTSTTETVATSSVAATGRASTAHSWMPATESPTLITRTVDTAATFMLKLTEAEVAKWHLNSSRYTVGYRCTPLDSKASSINGTVTFNGPATVDGTVSETVDGLPVDATCEVTGQNYTPTAYTHTSPSHYGAAPAAGYGYTATGPLTLDLDASKNQIDITNTFTPTSLKIGKTVTGTASHLLDSGLTYEVAATCSFNGTTQSYGPYELSDGESRAISDIPVGADCTVIETDSQGATTVTGTHNGNAVTVNSNNVASLANLTDTAVQEFALTNTFTKGSAIEVVKNVTRPKGDTSVGDFEFTTSCTLDGNPVSLPSGFTNPQKLTFAAHETTKSFDIEGLPVGTTCTVSETDSSNASKAAPDKTVTTTSGSEPVRVLMENIFDPAKLTVHKTVAGSAASENWVPTEFEAHAECSRELTINGTKTRVTDFSGSLPVQAGKTVAVEDLPEGTLCQVAEHDSRGADLVVARVLTEGVEDRDGPEAPTATVTLIGPENGTVRSTDVEIINTYATSTFTVVKKREGAQASVAGTGPFEVSVGCTWNGSGVPMDIDLGDKAVLKLNKANQYTASITTLPRGAVCSGVEKDSRGATAVSYSSPVTTTADGAGTFTVTNRFDAASIQVSKKTSGAAPDGARYGFALACERTGIDGKQATVPVATSKFELAAGQTKTLEVLKGSKCRVTETESRGAVDTVIRDTHGKSDDGIVVATGSKHSIAFTNAFSSHSSSSLPWTGSEVGWLIGLGLLFLAGGAAVLLLRKRRID